MVEFGFFILSIGLCLALYGFVFGVASIFRPHRNILFSARNALLLVPVCVLIAMLVLWDATFSHDFTVRYVYRNSSVDMPPLYLFTSLWSALEGSHLLWTFLLTAVSALALLTLRPRNQSLLPGLVTAFGIAQSYMLLLTVWESGPFTRLFPAGQFGNGMNALLQNPYMAIHPPILFSGYSTLIVPFAYGFAAMVRGGFSPEWLVSVRRWVLASWAFLTIGIFLGGKWAYVELGWAGYWAWDPVENASFMPWLSITAALHCLLILDKTGRLPRLTIFLSMFAFILTFLGTFITRSGVISSVHSFAESNIGPAYLVYIVFLLFTCLSLLIFRGDKLQGAARANTWALSKESTLLYTNFFLILLLAIVLFGTMWPIVTEAIRGEKTSVQQPFFNFFTPWIGVALVSLIGVGNLLKWRSGKIEDAVTCLGAPLLWSAAITACFVFRKNFDIRNTIGYFLVIWSALVLIMDLVYKLKALRFNGTLFLKLNRPYFGSLIVHLGFLLAIAGFLGGYRDMEVKTTLGLNAKTSFYDYTFVNEGLRYAQGSNVQNVFARIKTIDARNGDEFYVEPMRAKYSTSEDLMNEIGIHSTFWHDIYIVLATFDPKTQSVGLSIHINPTVKFVWTSLVIMVLGVLISLSHKVLPSQRRSSSGGLELETATQSIEDLVSTGFAENYGWRKPGVVTSVAIIGFTVATAVFGFSGLALAADGPTAIPQQTTSDSGNQPVVQANPLLTEVGQELRCPTCTGISILESDTPQSVAMRTEIEKQLSEGKSKQEILDFFQERYGEWILRQPDSRSISGMVIWGLPIAAFIIGPCVLLYFLRRSRQREQIELANIKNQLRAYINQRKQEENTP